MIEKSISKVIEEQSKIDIYKAIIAACEKQIPKTPIEKEATITVDGVVEKAETIHVCPVCGWCVIDVVGRKEQCCSNCGQKLSWEE